MLHGRGDAFVILDRTHTGIEVENLAQGYVQRADAASYGRRERAFDGHTKFADGADGVVGQPRLKTGFGFFAGRDLVPGYGSLSAIALFPPAAENAHPHALATAIG